MRHEQLPLLSIKELAAQLGRSRTYVHAMKRLGFSMPGGLATITEARGWLARNPSPRSRKKQRCGTKGNT